MTRSKQQIILLRFKAQDFLSGTAKDEIDLLITKFNIGVTFLEGLDPFGQRTHEVRVECIGREP